jgi:hypothetical protein
VFSVSPDSPTIITDEWIRKCLDEYNKHDDVFREEFLACVVFNASTKPSISNEAIDLLRKHGMKEYVFTSSPDYFPGPYVIVDQELREVWKLVDDSNRTCMVTLKPQKE